MYGDSSLLAFIPAFTHVGLLSPRALGMVFFVWVSVFNLIVVSVFWIFMSDIWSLDQSKRLSTQLLTSNSKPCRFVFAFA